MGMAISVPRYTVHDLEQFPEDGNRYELLNGMLLVTPQATFRHQRVALRLAAEIHGVVHSGKIGCVVGPAEIEYGELTHLEPDVLVVPWVDEPDTKWADIAEHWLAIEVYSPSSKLYDRDFKRDAYLAMGVREVWLVDTDARSITVCRAGAEAETMHDSIVWRVPGHDAQLTIALHELFA